MKVVQINSVYGRGSTGRICLGIAQLLKENGTDNRVLYSGAGVEHPLGIRYTSQKHFRWQALRSRLLGNFGFNTTKATRELIAELDKLSPEIVHIHNIHSHDCHFEMLLSYLKEKHIKTVWTFHDCWCFTGYCTYFDVVNCSRWKDGCRDCPQRKQFSWLFDRSSQLYARKKAAVEGLDLTIVTPSRWLADMVKASFFKDYPVRVIYNGIDLDVFRPTTEPVVLQKKPDEKIVLGVAFGWGHRKGLDVFVSLAERLPSDYRIVLVGTDDQVDKMLPDNITSIHRTHSQRELASLYTLADVFVNPTREEVLGLTNIEANACGTPVITFRSGGSPECIDENSGMVVECNDVDALEKAIVYVCEQQPFSKDMCMQRAKAFDMNARFMEYIDLYGELL